MALEIERKFLLKPGAQLPESDVVLNIQQAYIANDEGLTVRIRLINMEEAYLTIKKALTEELGIRSEFEYPIPVEDAIEMMQLNHYSKIVKQRHIITDGARRWEVDFFLEENEGLIIAELELPSLEETVIIPEWIGEEVTNDPHYLNYYLAQHPYSTWNK
ncbi:CYTH domain-containing protein [Porphyromonas levii]|uniref:CYTH domain-containing protein n=1 Tax=Porphyromonas levii TaxID=28114 RepID=UPI001B8B95C1|nr:CYTH domain-containing protein [Porphyromonas levii]MBR8759654.1 Inorganic triphosphatase [Porphyromonas levii]MBR8763539.1 Inorganic triphosphatase [Porphyromonas levii]MBR8784494.1 Inorganic triphosphatase [Porphyromonas levii]MBR8802014.1 Inorganic triphosphatase [Porphyromonas levii]